MNRRTLLSFVLAALCLQGCGDPKEVSTTEPVEAKIEEVTDKVTDVVTDVVNDTIKTIEDAGKDIVDNVEKIVDSIESAGDDGSSSSSSAESVTDVKAQTPEEKQVAEMKEKMPKSLQNMFTKAGLGLSSVAESLGKNKYYSSFANSAALAVIFNTVDGLANFANPKEAGKRLLFKTLACWSYVAVIYALAYVEHWMKRWVSTTSTYATTTYDLDFRIDQEDVSKAIYYGYNDGSESYTGKSCIPYADADAVSHAVTAGVVKTNNAYHRATPPDQWKCESSYCWASDSYESTDPAVYGCHDLKKRLNIFRLVRVVVNPILIFSLVLSVYAIHSRIVFIFGELKPEQRKALFPLATLVAVVAAGLGVWVTGFKPLQPDSDIVEHFNFMGRDRWGHSDDALWRGMFITLTVIMAFTFPLIFDAMALVR